MTVGKRERETQREKEREREEEDEEEEKNHIVHFINGFICHDSITPDGNMDFSQEINDYRESGATTSPIWIWFKKDDKESLCMLCSKKVPRPDSSTTAMVNHLKRFHGFMSKHNAWKDTMCYDR